MLTVRQASGCAVRAIGARLSCQPSSDPHLGSLTGVAALPLDPDTACHVVVGLGGDGEVVVVEDRLNDH